MEAAYLVLQVPVMCTRIRRRHALEFNLDAFSTRRVHSAARRSYPPALWIEGLLVTTWRRRLRYSERGEIMVRFGLFSATDSGHPTPACPCISRSHSHELSCSPLHRPRSQLCRREDVRRTALHQEEVFFHRHWHGHESVAGDWTGIEVMNTLDASPSRWLGHRAALPTAGHNGVRRRPIHFCSLL